MSALFFIALTADRICASGMFYSKFQFSINGSALFPAPNENLYGG
ncbi:hypothetical protein RCH06_001331 [Polaromonas sp. CG_9.5]|nr:hypothetical protein [Polaromonas sp. CG_9.5]